jgi:hypothetical protein
LSNVDQSNARSNFYYSLIIVAAFFCAGLFGILHHEMWRDELQAWLIARDTNLLVSRHALGYDGHPILWYLVLYCVTRVTQNPLGMQLAHLAIATAAIFVFVFYSPLGRLQKALFSFGYFPLYEYAVISRNYSLGVLLVFCFCALLRRQQRSYIYLAVILALLANTSAYGLLMSGALALFLVLESGSWRNRVREIASATVIYLAGVFGSLWVMKGVSDSGNVLAWRFWGRLIDVGIAVGIVWRGFFPIPGNLTYFWNKNFVTSWELGALLGILVLVATALVFRRSRPLLLAYLIGVGAIVAFTYVKFYGSIRHHGHVFILFIACYWLLPRFKQVPRHLVTGLLVLHVALAVVALRADYAHPFSNSKRVVDYLRSQGLQDVYIVADRDTIVSPLTAYLDHGVYYPRGDREGTFIIWDQTRLNSSPPNSFDIARQKAQTVLVITNTRQDTPAGAKLLAEFTGSLAEDENYFLYLVTQ